MLAAVEDLPATRHMADKYTGQPLPPVIILPRWDEVVALESIQKVGSRSAVACSRWQSQCGITIALIVPPIDILLLQSSSLSKYDISSCILCVGPGDRPTDWAR